MWNSRHRRFALALELVLVAMRLSCEGFFVLAATYAAYLLRGPPRLLAAVIRAMSALSLTLQCALSVFPAVCWVYGAGPIFSTFVSLVFWGAPAWAAYEFVAGNLFSIMPQGVRRAGRAVQERAGPQCAICWGAFEEDPETASEASSGSDVVCVHAADGCQEDGSRETAGSGGLSGEGWRGMHEAGSVDSAEAQAWGPELGAAAADARPLSGNGVAVPEGPSRKRRRWFPFGRRKVSAAEEDSEEEVASWPVGSGAAASPVAAQSPVRRSGDGGPISNVGPGIASGDRLQSAHAHAGPASGSGAGDVHGGYVTGDVGQRAAALSLPEDAAAGDVSDARSRYDGPADGEEEGEPAGVLHDKAIVVTECRHVFHYGCLSHWLHQCTVGMRSTACPLCQRQIDVEIRLDTLGLLRRLRQQLRQPPPGGGGDGRDNGADEVRCLSAQACLVSGSERHVVVLLTPRRPDHNPERSRAPSTVSLPCAPGCCAPRDPGQSPELKQS